jgi:hypothetical protein
MMMSVEQDAGSNMLPSDVSGKHLSPETVHFDFGFFVVFPSSLQADVGKYFKLGHDCFHPHLFQSITQ